MTDDTSNTFEWKFLINWILASATGLVASSGFLVYYSSYGMADWYIPFAFWVVLKGLCIGVLQYFVLRRVIMRTGWWILATTVGWALTPAVNQELMYILSGYVGITAFTTVSAEIFVNGVLLGVLQSFVLSKRIPRAGLWVPATLLGLIAGWFMSYVSNRTMLLSGFETIIPPKIVDDVAFGIGMGAVTGFGLIRLLNKNPAKDEKASKSLKAGSPEPARARTPLSRFRLILAGSLIYLLFAIIILYAVLYRPLISYRWQNRWQNMTSRILPKITEIISVDAKQINTEEIFPSDKRQKLMYILEEMKLKIDSQMADPRYTEGNSYADVEVFRILETDEYEMVASQENYWLTAHVRPPGSEDEFSAASLAWKSGKTTHVIPPYYHFRDLVIFEPLKSRNEVVAILSVKPGVYLYCNPDDLRHSFRLGLIALIMIGTIVFVIGEHLLLGQYRRAQAEDGPQKEKKWYPSLFRIVRGDTTANYLMIPFTLFFPILLWVIYQVFEKSYIEAPGVLLFFILFCSFPIPIILRRAFKVRALFRRGVETECIHVSKAVKQLGYNPQRGKEMVEFVGNYVYYYENQAYPLTAKLMKRLNQLKPGEIGVALVNPDNPREAIYRDNFI